MIAKELLVLSSVSACRKDKTIYNLPIISNFGQNASETRTIFFQDKVVLDGSIIILKAVILITEVVYVIDVEKHISIEYLIIVCDGIPLPI